MKRSTEQSMEQIPNKLYFRIGEVSDIVGVKPYVLRYWESEFPDIKPAKSKSGQRLYKRRDVETLLSIKQLLYHERFTINGARRRLKEWVKNGPGQREPQREVGPHEEKNEPRHVQVEAFVKKEPVSQQQQRSLPPQRLSSSPPDGVEKRKILIKIRKDLEALLGVMQS